MKRPGLPSLRARQALDLHQARRQQADASVIITAANTPIVGSAASMASW